MSSSGSKVKAWISAFRLRTLPLALASIGMGSFLAAAEGKFNLAVVGWCMLTTLLLQILSNLANDYGDTKHGADSIHRQGPQRAVQAGLITPGQMKRAMVIFTLLSLFSGLMLLWTAFGHEGLYLFLLFLGLGLAAIWAAINYTAGAKPYGYAGLGDISVFLFFGLVGVGGTYFLQTQSLNYRILLPAASLGFFSTAVLNVNNIRDIESDRLAGKYSLPVRLGPIKARIYHLVLLTAGFLASLFFVLLTSHNNWQFLFLLALPLLGFNGWQVWRIRQSKALDPYLKQMALTTLVFVVSFGIGLLL
ncbi:1,4-dihydroxy-2-naphthoate polyprenyltransferase [Adhaeribacter rhizoryzae]|uniref:1,4-dihydroxy-2-naphthoate octaprenyltransferase n=1 Tax=Adhaeribacter rhizoryzae TaxID=2607907 RepID=A0A5M6DMD9_9BACT|nr:1,4-dihydroxy-2-naphthoate polyprenyltransferase [Adhaeribacter rhizoryzae]KAA5547399.1 1,4-dihydroxy-2-naphthoate polyprenyltransferase [Adhaeribacter rhizoryzae]